MAGHGVVMVVFSGNQVGGWRLNEQATDDLFPGLAPAQIVEAVEGLLDRSVDAAAVDRLEDSVIGQWKDANVSKIS